MKNIIYLEYRKNGVHCYTPELGERKPEINMEAFLSHDGKHYCIATPLLLKGRGITEVKANWVNGCKKQIENWKSYRVTINAFKKLENQFSIALKCLLD